MPTHRTDPQQANTRQRAFRRGDRVEVTRWTPHPTGRVTNVAQGSVFVAYDNSVVEDELDPQYVQPLDTAGDDPQ